jgi:hypothetical protein
VHNVTPLLFLLVHQHTLHISYSHIECLILIIMVTHLVIFHLSSDWYFTSVNPSCPGLFEKSQSHDVFNNCNLFCESQLCHSCHLFHLWLSQLKPVFQYELSCSHRCSANSCSTSVYNMNGCCISDSRAAVWVMLLG